MSVDGDQEGEDPKVKKWSVRRCLQEFCGSTTMHGAARVGNPGSPGLVRIFWLVLMLVAAGWSGYNVTQIILTYLEYPVSTVVSVEYEENLPFPAVTVCNLNQFRFSEYNDLNWYMAWDDTHDSETPPPGNSTPPPSYSTSSATPSTLSATTRSPLSGNNETDPYYNGTDYFEDYDSYGLVSELRTFLDKFSYKERNKLGHQLDKMLINCNYDSHKCTQANFTQFWNHMYGNCFTFNKDKKATSVSKSGPVHGLSLLLNAENEEYLVFTDTVGFKVVVHPADAMPFPEDEGIIVSPGFATSVGIRRMDITRTPEPYGRCNHYTRQENVRVNMYALEYDVGYTDKACQISCFQRRTIYYCGCCDADFPCIGLKSTFSPLYDYMYMYTYNSDDSYPTGAEDNNNGSTDGNGATYCNMTDSVEKDCLTNVRSLFQSGSLNCKEECRPTCSETLFEVEVSMGMWPSQAAIYRLTANFEKMPNDYFGGDGFQKDFIRDNVVKVDIYFKQLNYEHLQTIPAYNWYRLLSDLGGQMGLWLGFSLLTAMEVMSLLVDLARHTVFKLLHKNRGNKFSKQDRVFPTKTPVQKIKF